MHFSKYFFLSLTLQSRAQDQRRDHGADHRNGEAAYGELRSVFEVLYERNL